MRHGDDAPAAEVAVRGVFIRPPRSRLPPEAGFRSGDAVSVSADGRPFRPSHQGGSVAGCGPAAASDAGAAAARGRVSRTTIQAAE